MPEKATARRLAIRLLPLGAAAASAVFVLPVTANAAPTTAQVSASVASHESHGLHGLAQRGTNDSVTSGNWSGYAATGSTYKSVSSSWVQPSITCGSQDTYSSFWVGLDGYNNSALEQTGTEADCVNGQAQYGAWWEVLPAAESPYSVTVKPGDHLTASVTDNGDGTFTMKLSDSDQGWTKTTNHAGSSGYQDSSAEVVAEATSVGGQIAQLSNFGKVDFTNSQANGSALPDSSTEITMQNQSSGDTLAQPGSLSNGAFTDTWKNSS